MAAAPKVPRKVDRLVSPADEEQARLELQAKNQRSQLELEKQRLALAQAQIKLDQSKIELEQSTLDRESGRKHTADVLSVFRWLNGGVFAFVVVIWVTEFNLSKSGHFIITDKTVLALIASSTAQLGAMALGLSKKFWR